MNNTSQESTKLSFMILIKYCVIAFFIAFIFVILKFINIIQTDPENIYSYLVEILIILVIIQIISPRLHKRVIDEIRFRGKKSTTILFSILTGIGARILICTISILPTFFGGNVIGIAKGQLDISNYSFFERILVVVLFGPCEEEFLFRVLIFTFVSFILGCITSKLKMDIPINVFNTKSVLCWVLVLVVSIGFSLCHQPDLSNFSTYFIPGLVFTIMYIKYGFYSAWISHGVYNLIAVIYLFVAGI